MKQFVKCHKKSILLICISIILAKIAFDFGKSAGIEQIQSRNMNNFVNWVYSDLYNYELDIKFIDQMKYDQLDEVIVGPYNMMLEHLNQLGARFEDASHFMNSGICYPDSYSLFHYSSILTSGLTFNNQPISNGFWDDKKLSVEEKAFLRELGHDLSLAKKRLSRYLNGTDYSMITTKELNNIFKPIFDHYAFSNLQYTLLITCR